MLNPTKLEWLECSSGIWVAGFKTLSQTDPASFTNPAHYTELTEIASDGKDASAGR